MTRRVLAILLLLTTSGCSLHLRNHHDRRDRNDDRRTEERDRRDEHRDGKRDEGRDEKTWERDDYR
ncbi:hypothetical protein [Chlorobium sp. N1]|uniref:hypothetical protein n=1 Tax=Chlorobium sp. N1 TaxID=2491138 RepID=UPI00103E1772|nr:hypothetical protein [Chlorobium sp. N1]TCD48613.1 hypothetical protein E0L29_01670 [Chlorobium sp. N1]